MLLYIGAGAKNMYFNLHLTVEIETVPKIQILAFEQGNGIGTNIFYLVFNCPPLTRQSCN